MKKARERLKLKTNNSSEKQSLLGVALKIVAHAITSIDELEEGAMGIPDPSLKSTVVSPESTAVSPESIDLVLVSCLTRNAEGCRLGYG